MRQLFGCALLCVVTLFAACSPAPPAAVKDAGPPFRPTGTIKDIMDSVVDPAADVLWDSVATTITREGQIDKAPKTDEEWKSVRRHAVALMEATNLLLMEGRHVAREGEKSEFPGIELEPAEMEKLIAADRASWVKHAQGLYDAAGVALKAIDGKNVQGLLDAGEGIDAACENCHKQYWYPEQKKS